MTICAYIAYLLSQPSIAKRNRKSKSHPCAFPAKRPYYPLCEAEEILTSEVIPEPPPLITHTLNSGCMRISGSGILRIKRMRVSWLTGIPMIFSKREPASPPNVNATCCCCLSRRLVQRAYGLIKLRILSANVLAIHWSLSQKNRRTSILIWTLYSAKGRSAGCLW